MAEHAERPIDGAAVVICLAAVVTDLLCRFFPARLPYFFPFIFNAPVFLGTWFTLLWYFRGLARVAEAKRPGGVRQAFFLVGVLSIYFVLQTRFEYLSQHLFCLNRVQAVTLSMAAPFCIGIAWMQDVLAAGVPGWLLRAWRGDAMRSVGMVLLHPLPATALFLLTSDIWLIPQVHFAAMINPALYAFMNLSCLVGGMLFWLMVLDPRPKPFSRLSFITRAGLGFLVMFPQIAISSYIALTTQDLYSFYTLCGRIFPAMSPAYDQMLGGMIQWIPPGMMNTAALMLALNAMRLSDAETDKAFTPRPGAKVYEAKWTGR
jgi:putative membrane protein